MSVTVRILVGVFGFAVMMAGGITCNMLHMNLVSEVNSRLPVEARFAELGWGPDKRWRVIQEYRRLFPTGARLRRMRTSGLVMVAGLVLTMAAIGFPVVMLFVFGMAISAIIWFQFR